MVSKGDVKRYGMSGIAVMRPGRQEQTLRNYD